MSIYYKVGSRWTTRASWPTTIGNERRDLCQPGELSFDSTVLFFFNLIVMISIIFLHPHGLHSSQFLFFYLALWLLCLL